MPLDPAIESGDRSHTLAPVESVAQISTLLLDTDPTLDPALAAAARTAAGEGAVLLTNDGTLPLGSRSVAVFGRVQIDWFAVGYGSGGDVKVPYIWNLLAGLRDAGVRVDEQLASRYATWSAANRPVFTATWGQWPHHFPEMPIDVADVEAAASRADTAVVALGRAAGEARESVLEPGSYYLTEDERTLLDAVTAHFDRTVVVLDAGNVMDLAWLAEYGDRIGAVLYAWQGGMEGARAIAGVLAGESSPSGKLTDTIARSYADYPSAPNFGHPDANEYAEDVFVGYRYFETFAPERVLFPFGFGLSYTTFGVRTDATMRDAGRLGLEVTVTNTGATAGREVVQVYTGAPDGALGKPARHLAAFAKTGELSPGASETLHLEVHLDDLASYDDGGATGHRSSWVLEAGAYPVFVGTDVRSAAQVAAFDIAELRVVRALAEVAAPVVPFERITLARRADGSAVIAREPVPTSTVSRADRVRAMLPPEVAPTGDRGIGLADVAAGTASLDGFVAQLTDEELSLLARGDVTMHSPLGAPGNAGVLGGVSASLRAKGVPPITTTDGPSGLRLSAYASLLPSGTALASTWNAPLVEEVAALHGQEMLRKGSDVLLSPGMNIHRDPLCGRNFEYFSEDPVLTGRMAAAVVRGVQSAGVSACPKHFAANNQETNRTRNDSRVSERALREIYLRGFEICVREAAPRTIMTSYNQINGVWAHYHHDLVTVVLREEWGYEGVVVTDWWMEDAVDPDFPALADNAYRVRAQVDVLMPGGVKTDAGPQAYADDTILESLARDGGLTRGELQRTARNVLRLALALKPVVDARTLEE
ncbi:glycoside hydrolase family 3 C-terminal domain-containing protein [Microbacterium sp. EYE_5]|uniref:glycoside hydrolase family 3 protein n=1 Tax=unclassified Microbacterium TaxID=2609290 RepID=UPI0020059F7A|nr:MULTISPECIES: glycoside hydrolase family 3 protein [unclassified Microbacterium]MCK6079932.1 glycoside hydrolase family 3 C-terminal domain-containing protein [Microbacterium sp. EYE_382]MCK6085203.1 glycoside hydrolase family 3 C-terminal domain-containing protein [Microbacterium sp. EYE_384]MCK6122571.1 glycoside hydrolase family 3 C-terminal domain-containing protein [Microbacterium sp. EYE_80]MCK6125966.1 glycoside hydrolase family 3 C-terminal domain-containing protein [Microbacterium s